MLGDPRLREDDDGGGWDDECKDARLKGSSPARG